jgi:hypothetical protein
LSVLFGGAVGALSVFFLGLLKEWWQRDREQKGLLRLVDAEIGHNDSGLTELSVLEDRDYDNEPPGRPLRLDAWEQNRAKLAQLLPHEKLTDLSTYYRNTQTLNNLLDPHTSPSSRRKNIPGVVRTLADHGTNVRAWIQGDYIGRAP